MTNNDESASLIAIQKCRNVNLRAAYKYHQQGVSGEDVAIASLYSTMDLATGLNGGDPIAAIEWLRNGCDMLERQLMGKEQPLQ